MPNFFADAEIMVSDIRNQALSYFEQHITVSENISWSKLSKEILTFDKQLQKDNEWRAQDLQGAIYLKMSCTLLAAYRTMKPLNPDEENLLDVIRDFVIKTAIGDDADAFLYDRYEITPDASEKAWELLCGKFIESSRERMGCSWVAEKGLKDQKRFFVNYTKCGFADFFLDNDARDVLYTLCASDYAWCDGLKKYNIRFERPTMVSEGGDACRFQFFKE